MDIREAQTTVKQELAKHHDTMIQFLRDIVAIPSFDSQIGPVGDAIGARLMELGFDEVRRDSMGNILGRIGKGLLWIAIAEVTIAGEIAGKAVVQQRCAGRERAERLHDSSARAIFDIDQLGRVLGAGAVGRNDHSHGLADIAHAIHRDRPALDRRLDADDEARCQCLDILAAQDRGNTGRLLR